MVRTVHHRHQLVGLTTWTFLYCEGVDKTAPMCVVLDVYCVLMRSIKTLFLFNANGHSDEVTTGCGYISLRVRMCLCHMHLLVLAPPAAVACVSITVSLCELLLSFVV